MLSNGPPVENPSGRVPATPCPISDRLVLVSACRSAHIGNLSEAKTATAAFNLLELKRALSRVDFDYVHFRCHGVFDPEGVDVSLGLADGLLNVCTTSVVWDLYSFSPQPQAYGTYCSSIFLLANMYCGEKTANQASKHARSALYLLAYMLGLKVTIDKVQTALIIAFDNELAKLALRRALHSTLTIEYTPQLVAMKKIPSPRATDDGHPAAWAA